MTRNYYPIKPRSSRRKPRTLGRLNLEPEPFTRRSADNLRRNRPAHRYRRREPASYARFFRLLLAVAAGIVLAAAVFFLRSWYENIFQRPQSGVELSFSAQPEVVLPPLEIPRELSLFHKVRRGDTYSSIGAKYGISAAQCRSVYEALRELGKKEDVKTALRAGQVLELELASDGGLNSLKTKASSVAEIRVERASDGKYQARMSTLVRERRERAALGVIESSFAAAAAKAKVSYDIVDDLVDILGSKISFARDFRKGDRFTVIYRDRVLEDGSSFKSGPILAVALEVGEKQVVAVRYVGTDGRARYFDAKGELIENSFLRYPLRFSRISSHFSHSRLHPILKRRRPHHGVDFAAPIGTPVRSVADGKVVFAGRKGGAGIMIKIKHSPRYTTIYMHLSKIGRGIRRGTKVSRGQYIAAVGSSGLSTGPHLDYRLIDRGRYVDPLHAKLPVLTKLSAGTKIHSRYLERVLYTLEHYQEMSLEDSYWGKQ